MTSSRSKASTVQASGGAHVNQVLIVGRVAAPSQSRELPSGDVVAAVRVIVDREPGAVRGRATVDTLDCAVWSAGLRRRVGSWRSGDLVEVRGAVRRRFFRSGEAVGSRFEIEVTGARRVTRRAASG